MDYKRLLTKALEIQKIYRDYNQKRGERKWEVAQYAESLSSDVSDLIKAIQCRDGFRKVETNSELLINHELVDCLWGVITIANELGVDLENVYMQQMDELKKRLDK